MRSIGSKIIDVDMLRLRDLVILNKSKWFKKVVRYLE